MKTLRWRSIVLACLLVAGCTGSNYAPVYDYSRNSPDSGNKVVRGVHVVRSGETLYSIAWRYGWDYRALARANDIPPPHTIYPGDRIHLDRRPPGESRTSEVSSASSAPVSGKKPAPRSRPVPPESRPKSTASASGPLNWQWPADGEVVARYASSKVGQKGIAIASTGGSPVRAAEDGVVVYRGNGLTGYGNLLIVKHNDRWLSAYAHNRDMLVKEGTAVKAGDRIATMGASGTFRTQLHFEIRRDGKPVDPMPLLPGR